MKLLIVCLTDIQFSGVLSVRWLCVWLFGCGSSSKEAKSSMSGYGKDGSIVLALDGPYRISPVAFGGTCAYLWLMRQGSVFGNQI